MLISKFEQHFAPIAYEYATVFHTSVDSDSIDNIEEFLNNEGTRGFQLREIVKDRSGTLLFIMERPIYAQAEGDADAS